MIAVVADDFSGAAEIAGVGLRYGLGAEVQTELCPDSKADIVVVDTDTRSRPPREAAQEVKKVLEALGGAGADWIYKKVDSVLRGPVAAELEAVLEACGKERILLVPANPSLNRKIYDGKYFVHGVAVEKTPFAFDPEHPVRCSEVLTMLGVPSSVPVCLLNPEDAMAPRGIVVGQAWSKAHLAYWAEWWDDATLAAGGAEFFGALLEVKGYRPSVRELGDEPAGSGTALFVCTSVSEYSRAAVKEARTRGAAIAQVPAEVLEADDRAQQFLARWAADVVRSLKEHGRAIMAIGRPAAGNPEAARALRIYTAGVVEDVLGRVSIDELYVEGGSTASAIVRRLKWRRFFACSELGPGVVRMRVEAEEERYLTIKPGSYLWPDKVRQVMQR